MSIDKTAFDALVKRVKKLEDALKVKDDKIVEFDVKIVELDVKIMGLEKEVGLLKSGAAASMASGNSWAAVLAGTAPKTQEQISLINTMQAESNERVRREKNVVILGLPASTETDFTQRIEEEKKNVADMFARIGLNVKIYKVIRLRQNGTNGRVAPVIIELENKENRNAVLKASKSLAKHNEYQSVYINADLTESERVLTKQLRMDCKSKNDANTDKINSYFGIRGMRVVKLGKTQ